MTDLTLIKLDEQEVASMWKAQVKHTFQKMGEKPHEDSGLATAVTF